MKLQVGLISEVQTQQNKFDVRRSIVLSGHALPSTLRSKAQAPFIGFTF